MFKRIILAGLFLFWGALFPIFGFCPIKITLAASNCDGVIISEIMPNPPSPLSDSSDEWIELKNTTGADIDISGCKLKDMKGSVKEYLLPQETVISANGFVVFYNQDTKISMNNDEDGMALLNSSGNIISETAIYKNAPDSKSFVFNGSAWEWTTDITPGFEKNTPGDTPPEGGVNSCEGVIVSEIMPDPVSPLTDTNDEWIEIYNESGDPVNVGGCILTDTYKPGSTHEYTILGGTLAPGGFMVFYSKNTKISLNNSDGDSVRILSSDKKVVFETQNYGKAKPGQSWAYDGEQWFWTVAPTAGALNIIEAADESSDSKSSAAKKKTSAKSKASKAKAKSKPVSKSSKKKSANGIDVLGANTEGENGSQGKINDKVMGYILVTLAGVLLVGYVVYINKDFIYENTIKKLRRNG